MNLPEHFQLAGDYVCYRPAGEVTFARVIELCSEAVSIARSRQITRLLVDTTQLTGFDPPSTIDRFEFARRCALAADSAVKAAFLAKPEMIDPERFGLDVAQNRGFWTGIFASESEALQWLLDAKSA